MKQVFDYIEKHSKYVFVYDQSVKERLEYKVNIELQGKSIDTILAEVCRLANLKYYIQNRQVTITVNSSPKPTTKVKKTKHISGQVVDVTELPMIGATVRVKGSDVATITDLDGKFQIDVHEGSELLISYVGYMDKIVRIDSKNMYAVVMEEASKTLSGGYRLRCCEKERPHWSGGGCERGRVSKQTYSHAFQCLARITFGSDGDT